MQNEATGDKLTVKNGKIVCPRCRQKTTQRIDQATEAEYLPVWCARCKHEFIVNIKAACAELSSPR